MYKVYKQTAVGQFKLASPQHWAKYKYKQFGIPRFRGRGKPKTGGSRLTGKLI